MFTSRSNLKEKAKLTENLIKKKKILHNDYKITVKKVVQITKNRRKKF